MRHLDRALLVEEALIAGLGGRCVLARIEDFKLGLGSRKRVAGGGFGGVHDRSLFLSFQGTLKGQVSKHSITSPSAATSSAKPIATSVVAAARTLPSFD